MVDITGKEINIGDKVAVALGKSEMKIGTVKKVNKKKVTVESHIISGTFYPKAILVIPKEIEEMQKCMVYYGAEEKEFLMGIDETFEALLKEIGATKEDLEELEMDPDYIEFEFGEYCYTIERQ